MRKKRTIFILGIIGILVLGLIYKYNSWKIEEDKFLSVLNRSNADIEEIILSGWNEVNKRFMDEQDLNHKMNEIIKSLSAVTEDCKREVEIYEKMSKGVLRIDKEGEEYYVVLESFKNDYMDEKTYCSFKVKYKNEKDFNIFEEKQFLERIFNSIDLPVKLYVSVTGSYKGKMEKTVMQSTIDMILNYVNGYEVEKITNDDLTSISGYTNRIDDYIISNGKKVNMQIAMRYSPYYDKTYIWIGSPVMLYEY